jgi:UDP-glucose 4-epimerase
VTRVLLTGHEGKIGRPTALALAEAGYDVVGYDIASGDDVRDGDALLEAARGCRYVVHLAAIPRDGLAPPGEVIDINVYGTWNVLAAADACDAERVVVASSIQALGVSETKAPDYLPLDDDHPSYARSAYAVSKRLVEEMCRAFTAARGISTVCLRPVWVIAPEELEDVRSVLERLDAWGYRMWVDVRDVASAVVCALECPDPGHVAVLLAAADVAGDRPSQGAAAELGVPWRGGSFDGHPFRSLVDTRRARQALGWEPRYAWPRSTETEAAATPWSLSSRSPG